METNIITEVFDIDEISPAEYNPRVATKAGKEYLQNSLDEFGYVDPIIVNKRTKRIIGGHQRYALLKDQGVKKIETVLVDLDDEQEKALNIALNKTSEHFEWDIDKLSNVVDEIKEDIDVSKFGVDMKDIVGSVDWEENDLSSITKPEEGVGSGTKQTVPKERIRIDYECPNCQNKFKV